MKTIAKLSEKRTAPLPPSPRKTTPKDGEELFTGPFDVNGECIDDERDHQ